MPTTPETPELPEDPKVSRVRLTRRGMVVAVAATIVVALMGVGAFGYLSASDDSPTNLAVGAVEAAIGQEPAGDQNPFTNPEAFVGHELTLDGTVTELLNPNTFRMMSWEPGASETLLVVYSGVPAVKPNLNVQVTGTMTPFVKEEVESVLGFSLTADDPESVAKLFGLAEDDYNLTALIVTNLEEPENKPGTEPAVAKAPDAGEPTAPTTDPVISSGSTVASAPVTSAPAVPPASSGSGGSGGSGSGSGSGGSGKPGSGGSGGGETVASSNGSHEIAYTGTQTSGQHTDEGEFEATLTDTEGKGIEGARVTFAIKNDANETERQFRARTDRKGIASTTKELTEAPGEYKLVVSYRSRGERKIADKTTFVIEKDDTAIDLTTEESTDEESQESSGEEGSENGGGNGETILTAALTDADDGAPLEGRTVNFYADGELIGSAITDAYGVATFEAPSKYKDQNTTFEARFDGDDYYLTAADAA